MLHLCLATPAHVLRCLRGYAGGGFHATRPLSPYARKYAGIDMFRHDALSSRPLLHLLLREACRAFDLWLPATHAAHACDAEHVTPHLQKDPWRNIDDVALPKNWVRVQAGRIDEVDVSVQRIDHLVSGATVTIGTNQSDVMTKRKTNFFHRRALDDRKTFEALQADIS